MPKGIWNRILFFFIAFIFVMLIVLLVAGWVAIGSLETLVTMVEPVVEAGAHD